MASSIHEACKYFALFQKTPFRGKCAVVTSYNPQAKDVTTEEVGANTETDKQFIYKTYTDLLKGFEAKPGMTKTETYEEWAKDLFIKQPANMKLLVVVDKLLTGFDAPSCTYLYIDKSMQDHGLFQAICRVNRLDGEDKDFGYIVDYKDLFKKVENAIAVYTSELDHSAGGVSSGGAAAGPPAEGQERLDDPGNPRPAVRTRGAAGGRAGAHPLLLRQHGDPGRSRRNGSRNGPHSTRRPWRLVRAYANIADDLEAAGYDEAGVGRIKERLGHYLDVREIIRRASNEILDLKPYEADMRHLIDTYIEADEPRTISPFEGMGLLDLIVKTGIANAIASQLGGFKGNRDAIAETIENNVRSKIIKEHLNDPAYYERMSALLDEIIALRKAKALKYEDYLKRIAVAAIGVQTGHMDDTPEPLKRSPALRALYSNLKGTDRKLAQAGTVAAPPAGESATGDPVLDLAVRLDTAIKRYRPDGWRGVQARELTIKQAMYNILGDADEVERIFPIIKAQSEY